MSELEGLKWGDELLPTEEAEIRLNLKGRVGVFLGYHKKRQISICVILKGNRSVSYYHVSFWKRK